MRYFSAILFATTISFISSTNASDNNFAYYGISVQNNNFEEIEFSPDIEAAGFLPDIFSKNTSGTGARFLFGHQLNKYFAVEAGIGVLGEPGFKLSREIIDAEGTTTIETIHRGRFSTSTGDIRLVGTLGISEKMFLKVQAGSLFWNNKVDYLSGDINELVVETKSETGNSLITGIGVGYGISKNLAFSLDFENTEIAEINNQTVAISMMFRY